MANIFSNYSVFWDGLKLGAVTKSNIAVKNNGEPVFNDNGFDGNTKGNVTFEGEIELTMPFGGLTKKFEDLVLSGNSVTLLLSPLNGRAWQCEAFSNECSFDTDMEKRKTTCKVKVTGGKPKFVG